MWPTILAQSFMVAAAVLTLVVVVTGWFSGGHSCGHCDHDFWMGDE